MVLWKRINSTFKKKMQAE